jgi:hypothetical protein
VTQQSVRGDGEQKEGTRTENEKESVRATERNTVDLLLENATYGDLIFRDACPMLMSRHSLLVNYGNSPPIGDNLFVQVPGQTEKEKEREKVPNPDYPLRRMYKIDWKVCFLQIINSVLDYKLERDEVFAHVFVEDDSFVCIENLLFQLALANQREKERVRETETGKELYNATGNLK